ncbi:MAG: hypothetical protein IT376_21460 [Polyangiaceae bacterium]|nr:hypothetical protein [Polyangiaceae bacterium]
MRWSDRGGPVALVAIVSAAIAVHHTRLELVPRHAAARRTVAGAAVPPPALATLVSLGYRDALADYLFATLLVEYGISFQEKTRLDAGAYVDTINALAPGFRQPYLFADTFMTLRPVPPVAEDYRHARAVFLRGLAAFPTDAELWLTSGQFLAYVLPSRDLVPEAEASEAKLEGMRQLARACELVGRNENLPYHCVTAAHLMTRRGENEALVRFVERMLAVSDSDEIRELASGYLEKVLGEQARERAERRRVAFERAWGRDLAWVSRDHLLALGPAFDPARCAGRGGAAPRERCATSWSGWAEALPP